jgi:hypothetical protein
MTCSVKRLRCSKERQYTFSVRKGNYLGDLGVDGRTALKWFLRKSGGGCGLDWIHPAQDRVQW